MRREESWRAARLYTIGHSTRTLDELVELLRAFGVSVLADIRTIPRSRRNPQFNGDTLWAALGPRGIRYAPLPALGGLRHARAGSPNTAWRNESFRGYADYMSTEGFEAGLEELRALTAHGTVALMCAEAVPWRCHRSLVADVLTSRGAQVEHITDAKRARSHRLTPFARVEAGRVTYPSDGDGDRLATRAPFHLEATVRVLQRRPTNRVDVWDDARYVRALRTAGGPVVVEVTNRGTVDEPDVGFDVLSGEPSAAARAALGETLRRVLGLDVDPAPLERLAGGERRLRPTALALRGMRPPRFPGLFEAFANVIPFQQVSLDSGAATAGRLVERFGEAIEHEGHRWYAFPEPGVVSAASVEELRACGLSMRRAEALRSAARAIASGELSEADLSRMSTADAIDALIELPGIGRWSAALLLLRGLGRLDVFPEGDAGVARGLSELMGDPSGASSARAVERFGAQRGYLYFCALGGALLRRGLIHPAPAAPARKRTSTRG